MSHCLITNRSFYLQILLLCAAMAISLQSRADAAPELSGAQLYQHFCASCHGARARGDGPVAGTLKVRVPDLTLIARRNGGVFPTGSIHRYVDGQSFPTAHGTREMPVWGWQFYGRDYEEPEQRKRVDELITRLVDYVRSIQR